jgi:RNA polymerase sigma-70 factor (ECF subfamily)
MVYRPGRHSQIIISEVGDPYMDTSSIGNSGDRGRQARLSLISFPTFYKQYYPLLVRILVSQSCDTRWAEDVAQDTMLAAYSKWEELLTYERPDSWLFKVAIRRLRRIEAKIRRERPYPDDTHSTARDIGVAAAADEWVNDHLEVAAGVRALPRRQAEVIALHFLADYSLEETADILGISLSSVKTHKQRGLESLKKQGDSRIPHTESEIGETG